MNPTHVDCIKSDSRDLRTLEEGLPFTVKSSSRCSLSFSVKHALYSISALLGTAGAVFCARKYFADSPSEASSALAKIEDLWPKTMSHVTHGIVQTRDVQTETMRVIPDQLLDANKGLMWQQDVTGESYCKDPANPTQLVKVKNLPSWIKGEYSLIGNYKLAARTNALDVQVVGDTIFLATGSNNIEVLNGRNKANITTLLSYKVGSNLRAFSMLNNIATVCSTEAVYEVDFTDQMKPKVISTNKMRTDPRGTARVNNLIYMVDDQGLKLFNASSLATFVPLGNFTTPDVAYAVVVVGTTAYVSCSRIGLFKFDVSNSTNFKLLWSYKSSAYQVRVLVVGNTVFLTDSNSGLQIFDNSDQVNFKLLATYKPRGGATGAAILGDTLILAVGASGVELLDISTITQPRLIGNYYTGGYVTKLVIVGDTLYIVDRDKGLFLLSLKSVKLSGIPSKVERSVLNVQANCLNTIVLDNPMITTTKFPQRTGLTFSDISKEPNQNFVIPFAGRSYFTSTVDPFLSIRAKQENGQPLPPWLQLQITPQLIQSYDLMDYGVGVAYADSMLYVAAGAQGVLAFYAPDPDTLIYVSTYDTSGTAFALSVVDGIAYVADCAGGLVIISFQDPTIPKLLASFIDRSGDDPTRYAYATYVSVVDGFAYVADFYRGLQIYNVTIPVNPRLIYSRKLSDPASELSVENNLVSVQTNSKSVYYFDVNNKTVPVFLGWNDLPDYIRKARGIVPVIGNTAYAAYREEGMLILDIEGVNSTDVLGAFTTTYPVYSIAVVGPTAYLACGTTGTGALISVNLDRWRFIGNPKASDVGTYKIAVTAMDEYGGFVTDVFTISVEGPPVQVQQFAPLQIKTGMPLTYFVPLDAFSDPNEGTIIVYSASLPNGQPLTGWLAFNPYSSVFSGTPGQKDVGMYNVILRASDGYFPPVPANLQFIITHDNRPPQLATPIPSAIANVNNNFEWQIPRTAIVDPDGDPIAMKATLDGNALPSWLSFDANTWTFKGTPTTIYKTIPFDDMRLNIVMTASDPSAASITTNVVISLKGQSLLEWFINVGTPTITVLSALLAGWKKRAIYWNYKNKAKYTKDDQRIQEGDKHFSYAFTCDPKDIHHVKFETVSPQKGTTTRIFTLLDGTKICCKRKRGPTYKAVPNGTPSWIVFHASSGMLRSVLNGPEGSDIGSLRVRAYNNKGFILEQLNICVVASPEGSLGSSPLTSTPRESSLLGSSNDQSPPFTAIVPNEIALPSDVAPSQDIELAEISRLPASADSSRSFHSFYSDGSKPKTPAFPGHIDRIVLELPSSFTLSTNEGSLSTGRKYSSTPRSDKEPRTLTV